MFFAACVFLAAWTPLLLAQQEPGRQSAPDVYIAAGGMLVRQQGETYTAGGPFTPREGPTGVVAGVVLGAGIMMTPRLSAGGELALPRYLSHHQQTGTLEVQTEHRDIVAQGVLRFYLRPGAVVQPELLAGAGFARTGTRRALWRLAPRRTGPFEDRRTRTAPAVTVGAGLRIRASPHLSVVPAVRLDRIWRDPDDDFAGFLGLGRWVLRTGASLQLEF